MATFCGLTVLTMENNLLITRLLLLCGMALSTVLVTSVAANPVENLYVESVPVADQQTIARNEAASIGMAPVLIRVSGSSAVLLNSDIQEAIKKASRYLSKFSYQETPLQPVESSEGEEQLPYSLELQFRKPAILDLLRASNEPIWAENRPATLVWLVIDDIAGRRLPTDDDETELKQIVETRAARRGLPLVWPVYDLQEQATVSVDSLWAADAKAIGLASQRYDSSVTLLGRLLGTSDGKWRVAWEYNFNGEFTYSDSECEILDDCIAGPIDAVAELLSSRYALVSTDQGNVAKVKVAGVSSFEDYGTLLFYFKDLIAVSDVAMNSIKGDVFEFTLDLTANRERLVELISLNKRLVPVPNVAGSDETISDNSLVYQWR
jgi:hypothetical protein